MVEAEQTAVLCATLSGHKKSQWIGSTISTDSNMTSIHVGATRWQQMSPIAVQTGKSAGKYTLDLCWLRP